MNIYDIAEMAGVSIATVSRVVNGSDKVSETTRQKVLNVIDKAGYTPNVFAQGLGLNTMHTVGILVPDISDIYMSSAVFYLEGCLHKYGYDCILSCSGFETKQKEQHIHMLLDKHIDALILVGSTYAGSGRDHSKTDYIRDAAEKVPVFIINGAVEGKNIYSSVCDDRRAVYVVTRKLIGKGRRHILFLTDSHSYSSNEKMAGYEKALNDEGLPIEGNLKIHVKNDIHYVRDLLLKSEAICFDSVICTNDSIAVGVVKFAKERGLSIPREMDIVGYNNSVLAVSCEPEISSIDNHTSEICDGTIENVISVLQGDSNVRKHFTVPCTLVKRSTTDF